MIEIDFLRFKDKLRLTSKDNKRYIFDPVRRKHLVQLPEETVRQLVVIYLLEEKKYLKNRIAIEKSLKVNDLSKRCDILVYARNMQPHLLVECKAPAVPITQDAFRQIAWYNMPLRVRYLLVTNGISTYCCEMDYEHETFTFLSEVPAYVEEASR